MAAIATHPETPANAPRQSFQTTLNADGLLEVPKQLRTRLNLKPGSILALSVQQHSLVMVPVTESQIAELDALNRDLDVLLAVIAAGNGPDLSDSLADLRREQEARDARLLAG